ncbi:hypothetical protein KUTeg_017095 [Tegillarca granosa]|uniref:Hexosyltransferase n=1 Tax=Tegillarca granosa TaxID=220873 RepID=A0ABQ9ESH2_TEGGR|nr:hypothetical protein KUTeg_017095 [Tegillarca granosa]
MKKMSSCRMKNLLSWGQPDTHLTKEETCDKSKKSKNSDENLLEVEIEEKVSKQYLVSLEVHSIMKRKRTSPRVILKASITTVLVISVAFLILYTILLKYFTTSVPYHQYGGWSRYRLKFVAKSKGDNHKNLHHIYEDEMKSQPIRWNVSDIYGVNNIEPLCIKGTSFIILITSSPEHFSKRNEIRKTWCQPEKYGRPRNSWQCIFLVGEFYNSQEGSTKTNSNANLKEESQIHKDLLQGSYVDSYRNLTFKVVHGLHWVSRTCPVDYVLKTDDDCFVNANLLYKLVISHPNAYNVYIGNVLTELEKRKVVRDKQSRWHVPLDVYPEQYYPKYASGAGYLLSKDLVHRLVNVCKYIKPIPIEDAYIGILASKLEVSPAQSSRFTLMSAGWTICNYLYFIVIHSVVAEQQGTMHNNTISATQQCQGSSDIITWN